jgi:hypothetical protein
MKKKVVKLTEKDIERLVSKIIKEDVSRLTHSDMEFIDELYEEGMSAEDIAPEMDHKDYITVETIKSYLKQRHGLSEGRYDFEWDDVLGDGSNDKYHNLERDLSECIEPLIEKYKNDFGRDSYGVIDAIFQILEGMFQKV